jgi:uracil-DNA glycosylase family 4
MSRLPAALEKLEREIVRCERCPRLRAWCTKVARERRKSYEHETYWGRPIPGFGDPAAPLMIVGLAPAAHGGNRTGRVFTGDRSGDFLWAALHRAGLASQARSVARDDGLQATGVWVCAAVRCAPPENKPEPAEIDACMDYLEREMQLLGSVRAALTLGRIGHDALVAALKRRGLLDAKARLPFAHGAVHRLPAPLPSIVCSYHVSQQNTFTGKLTEAMFDQVVADALRLARA